MARKQKVMQIAVTLSAISQLGISVIVPIIFCIYGAGWLQKKFHLGSWILMIGIILGVGSGFYSMISLLHKIMKKMDKKNDRFK